MRYALILMMLARVSFGQLEMGPGTNVTVTGLTIPSAYPTNSLKAYYGMRTNGTTTVYDEWGSNDGTAVGSPTFSTANGVRDSGFGGNGSTQYIDINDAFHANTITVAAWARLVTHSSTYGEAIVSKFNTIGANDMEWLMWVRANQQVAFAVGQSDDTFKFQDGVVFATGVEWKHVVGTADGLYLRIYVNGKQVNAAVPYDGSIKNTTQIIQIGQYQNNTASRFAGSIDEVAIWSRALSDDEIEDLYNAGEGKFYPESPTVMAWVNSGGGWHHYASNELTYVDGVTNSFDIGPFSYDGTNLVLGGTNYIWDAPRAYSSSLTAGEIAYYVQRTAHRYDYALSTSTNLLAVSEPWDISDGNPDCVLALDFEHVGAGGDVAIGGDPRDHSRLASEVVATGAPIHRMPVRAGTGAALWTPADLTNNFLWFDANEGVLLSGSDVASWTDQSTGLIASNVTSTARPSLESDYFGNGLSAVSFDGVDEFLIYQTPANSSPMYMCDFITVGEGNLIVSDRTAVNWQSTRYFINYNTTSYVATTRGGANAISTLAAGSTTNATIQMGRYNGGWGGPNRFNTFLNATACALTTDSEFSTMYDPGDDETSIGKQGGSYYSGRYGEIIFSMACIFTATDRQKIEGYLAHKWGLEGNLPSDHPYKSAAPRK